MLLLPHTEVFSFDDEPMYAKEDVVQFRLLYDGRLPAQTKSDARVSDKHRIRKVFHKQLKILWNTHPALTRLGSGAKNEIANQFQRCGFNFIPLINEGFGCPFVSLDILFLRRSGPGVDLIQSGDLDNRIKVLFDALKIPKTTDDIGQGVTPDEDERPFHCLLEDDARIMSFSVTTDRLLTPFNGAHGHPLIDTVLVIDVKTTVFNKAKNYAETFW